MIASKQHLWAWKFLGCLYSFGFRDLSSFLVLAHITCQTNIVILCFSQALELLDEAFSFIVDRSPSSLSLVIIFITNATS